MWCVLITGRFIHLWSQLLHLFEIDYIILGYTWLLNSIIHPAYFSKHMTECIYIFTCVQFYCDMKNLLPYFACECVPKQYFEFNSVSGAINVMSLC